MNVCAFWLKWDSLFNDMHNLVKINETVRILKRPVKNRAVWFYNDKII